MNWNTQKTSGTFEEVVNTAKKLSKWSDCRMYIMKNGEYYTSQVKESNCKAVVLRNAVTILEEN